MSTQEMLKIAAKELADKFDKHIELIKQEYPEDSTQRVKYVKALCSVLDLIFIPDFDD
jgi:hypothetical protein